VQAVKLAAVGGPTVFAQVNVDPATPGVEKANVGLVSAEGLAGELAMMTDPMV